VLRQLLILALGAALLAGCLGDDDDSAPMDDDDVASDDDDTGSDDDDTSDDDDSAADDDDAGDDDAGDDDDAVGCGPDALEPNDTADEATPLDPSSATLTDLTVDLPDVDVFTLDACAGAAIGLTVSTTDEVLLTLVDSGGSEVGSDAQTVSWSGPDVEQLWLTVTTTLDVCVDYELTVDYDDTLCCEEEATEPNDGPGLASPLSSGVPVFGAALTADGQDWWSLESCFGGAVELVWTPVDPTEVVDLSLWTGLGELVEAREAVSGEQIFAVSAAAASEYQLSVSNLVSQGCLRYQVAGTLDPAGCAAACLDDAHEEDDLPGDSSGAVSASTSWTGLTSTVGDSDYFPVELCPDAVLTATATFDASAGQLDVDVTDALGVDLVWLGVEQVVFEPTAGGMYWVRTTTTAGDCLDYELELDVDDSACAGVCWDDLYEPNDTMGFALPLADGDWAPYQRVLDSSEDWFLVDLCDGADVEFVIDFVHTDGDIDASLQLASAAVLADSTSATDGEVVSYVSAADQAAFLVVSLNDVGCNSYALWASIDDSACPEECIDDGFEDHDDLASALPLVPPDTWPQMIATPGDPDWFSLDVCAGGVLSVGLTDGPLDPTELSLVDETGAELIPAVATADGWEASWTAVAAATAWIEVTSSGPTCSEYELSFSVDETGCCAADALEPDDAVGDATPVTETSSFVDLNQSVGDDDWFTIDLCEGGVLDVTALTDWPAANVDLHLWDPSGATLISADGYAAWEGLSWSAVVAETLDLQVTSAWGDCSIYGIEFTIDEALCPN
jgi:hypothetical protein